MQENFISIPPEHPLLKPLIAYYYFHDVAQKKGSYSVIYYPHYHSAINCYHNAEVSWNQEGRTIRQVDNPSAPCLFTRNTKTSRYVTIQGSIKKIGIVFNPLGINHFISCPLVEISKDVITPFHYFGDTFTALMDTLNGMQVANRKRDLLDGFFLERHLGFEDLPFKQLVGALLETQSGGSVQKMARDLGMHRKTVLRKFQKYLGSTPSEYKALIKFRNALHRYNSSERLTHIAYESDYYDQSHFIKNYKALVGISPKKLFANLSELGDHQTLWTKKE